MSHLYEDGIINRQIVSVTQNASDTVTSTTITANFVTATGASIMVTPKYTTSKFFIIATGTFNSVTGYATIFRNSTNLGDANFGLLAGTGASQFRAGNIAIYDDPGAISPITYEVRIRSGDGNSVAWGFGTHTFTVIEYDRNSGI